MAYNNNDLFGEIAHGLTKSLYCADYGVASHTPIDKIFLIAQDETTYDKLLAQTGENLIAQRSI